MLKSWWRAHQLATVYVLVVLSIALSLGLARHADQRDIHRSCVTTQREWDAFDRIITAATNPPSRAGEPLTAEQRAALRRYRQDLESALGDRPDC